MLKIPPKLKSLKPWAQQAPKQQALQAPKQQVQLAPKQQELQVSIPEVQPVPKQQELKEEAQSTTTPVQYPAAQTTRQKYSLPDSPGPDLRPSSFQYRIRSPCGIRWVHTVRGWSRNTRSSRTWTRRRRRLRWGWQRA